jgi:predicted phage terminase large subunit-like protein
MKKWESETIEKIIRKKTLGNPKIAKTIFVNDFEEFYNYIFEEECYYPHAPRHAIYKERLQEGKNILLIGHRESIKTQLAVAFVVWCICTKKRHFIIWGAFNKLDAETRIYDIRNIFEENEKIKRIYWKLLHDSELDRWKYKKTTTIKQIHFRNGVFLKASSLTTSTRWRNHKIDGITYRPDLYIGDDVDTNESVANENIIDKNYLRLRGQNRWWLSGNAQIVMLGNIIGEDGIIPRMESEFWTVTNTKRAYFRIPSYIHSEGVCFVDNQPYGKVGQFTRDRFVHTNKEAEEKNQKFREQYGSNKISPFISLEYLKSKDWEWGFNQNQLLIPYLTGDIIIKEHMINYDAVFEFNFLCRRIMGIDPAFSENTQSDSLAICIWTEVRMIEGKEYFIEGEKTLIGKEKELWNVVKTIVHLYQQWNCSLVKIEKNNGGDVLIALLKKEGLAVVWIQTTKDKVTKVRENEWFITNKVHFNREWTKDTVYNLTHFPNVKHDDLTDAFINVITPISTADISEMKNIKETIKKFTKKENWKYVGNNVLSGKF